MAHLWDLDNSQQTELNNPGIARIYPEVKITGQMYNPTSQNADGSWNFDTSEFKKKTLDLSNGVLNSKIVIKSSAPVLATKEGKANQQGNVRVQIDNSTQYISSLGDESSLDYFNIQDAEIEINAKCGAMTALPVFKGKVVKQPEEEEGKTTFDVRTILWDLVDVNLEPEISDDNNNQITTQLYVTSSGEVIDNAFLDAIYVEHIHPLGTFGADGRVRPRIENSSPEKVDLLRVEFQSKNGIRPLLGEYTIKFINDNEYEVTQPDQITLPGSTAQLFDSGFLQIFPQYWKINLGDLAGAGPWMPSTRYNEGQIVYHLDRYWIVTAEWSEAEPGRGILFDGWQEYAVDLGLSGTTISFYCSYNVRGNPIRIVKNLIHKALTGRWGKDYALDTSVSVDWDTLDALELIYNSAYIYLSETNTDIGVYSPQSAEKPIRIKDLLQKILDHIGCKLTFDGQGRLTVASSFYRMPWERQLYTYESAHLSRGETRKPSHKIFGGGPNYDFLRVKYGYDPVGDTYAGVITQADGTRDKYNAYEIAFPYFKTPQRTRVEDYANKFFEIVKSSDIRLELSLLPAWGLPLNVGDKFKVSLSVSPVLPNTVSGLGEFWEIYDLNKNIGGVVTVKCKMIPEPQNPADSSQYCFALYCESTYC